MGGFFMLLPFPTHSEGAAYDARPRGHKCRPKSCRFTLFVSPPSLYPFDFLQALFLPSFLPFILSTSPLCLLSLPPSCVFTAAGRIILDVATGGSDRHPRARMLETDVDLLFLEPVIGSNPPPPPLMSSSFRCLFFAPQHKRFLFLESLTSLSRKGGGGVAI